MGMRHPRIVFSGVLDVGVSLRFASQQVASELCFCDKCQLTWRLSWMEFCSEQTAFKPNVCGGANKLLPLRGAVCGGFGGTRIRCPSVEVELRSLRRGIFCCEIHSFLRSSIGASVRGVVFLVYCGADKVLPLRGAVCGGFG